MDRIKNIENQIEHIKEEIKSENFEKKLSIQVDNSYRKEINQRINEAILVAKNKYPPMLCPLSDFVKLITKMLNNYERHLRYNTKIQYYVLLKDKYINFCYKEYGELRAKINSALSQLESIKRDEMTMNICPEHVKLFDLLNDCEYTNYSDVIDYVLDNDFGYGIQNSIAQKIEKITGDDLMTIQQINYLIDDLESCRQLLDQKKKEIHKDIQLINEAIQSLKNRDWYLWPSYPKESKCNSKEEYLEKLSEYDKSIFAVIEKYVTSLDEVSLSLIVAFCAQINLFDVTYTESVSGRTEKLIINSTTRKSYINYIRSWKKSFKAYLDMNIGGIN